MIRADSSADHNWLQHFHGMIAVMRTFFHYGEAPALDVRLLVLVADELPNADDLTASPPVNNCSIASQPLSDRVNDLWAILPRVQSLFKRSASILQPDSIQYESTLRRLMSEILAFKAELRTWSSWQPEAMKPTTAVRFTQAYTLRFPAVEDLLCPITRADTYADYFVAGMWMSYRQCQLHLTNLLCRISRTLSKDPEAYDRSREHAKLQREVQDLVDDMYAAIPFMLVGEQIRGSRPEGSLWNHARPPMLLGGLDLQWTLFTASILDIVSSDVRRNIRSILLWIGENLGLGQATVLACMDTNPPGGVTAKGDALKWAGFLL
ncbi:hypothetical protein BAUCODRAFT_388100 [Baudoinia panamericana UAMH 10762]|uniref:Uncharacterized protein n=1 Tax=Baudoinia panamericana (strain UAMH 10762) TaxID=717646 RepID=M2NI58_BAUPA|nr:uncharacterized protein BAUCODRAFT_388100 [Baudoinia panamericana UAMH 10762]EMC99034.1 hypothetical protein BAUCODRAFT_388100 [Baudoinia panamericana UAMH 10762]